MSRPLSSISPEVRALLDRERSIPPASAAERARALTRARAALVAGLARSNIHRSTRWPRWVAISAAACVASAAIGAAAYEIRAHLASVSTQPSPPLVIIAVPTAPLAAPAAVEPSASPAASAEPSPVGSGSIGAVAPARADTYAAELALLDRARRAVARDEFAAALLPIADHTRLFKNGRLAEEREALRVKALAGLGRTEQARRAAAAFEARFPRSVLLPSVTRMAASRP